MSAANPLETVMLGRRNPASPAGGHFARGVVVSVVTDGNGIQWVNFTIPAFDNNVRKFGPAPCPTWVNVGGAALRGPQVGDACLVAFTGAGEEDPWVLSWVPA